MKKIVNNVLDFFDNNPFAFIFILVLLISSPFLFFGKIFLSGDTIHFSYPSAEFFYSNYLSGLNPNLYLGFPLSSSFHYAYFNPVYLIFFKLFDFLLGYNLILALDILLGAFFFYLLARDIFSNKKEAIVATTVYLISQFNIFWLASITISNGLFLLPALCWVVIKITSNKHLYALFLPFILGYAFLSVHYQFIVMAFVGSCVFFVYCLWDKYDKDKSFFTNLLTPSILYFFGLVGGLILGAPQILNTIKSFESVTRSDFIVYEYLKPLDLIRYIFPSFNTFGLTSQEFLPYIGLLPLLLILFVIITRIRTDKKILFLTVIFLLFFSLMIKNSPVALLSQYLPVFKYFAQPVRWLIVGNLFLAILAGYGFKSFIESRESLVSFSKYYKKILIFLAFLLLLINAVNYFFGNYLVGLVQDYFDKHLYANTSLLPIDYYHDLIRVLINEVFYNFSFANLNIVLFLLTLISFYFTFKYIKNERYLSYIIILIITFDLLCSFFINTKFADKSLILGKPALTEFILSKEKEPDTFRVFSYAVSDVQYKKIAALHPKASEEIEKFSIEGLIGNVNDLQLIGGLEPNGNKKVQEITYFYLNDLNGVFTEKIPILSALNAKYIATPYLLDEKDLVLATSTLVTRFNVPIYLYENKKVLPRIYLAKTVDYLREFDDASNLNLVLNPKNNFNLKTYIECDDCSDYENKSSYTDKLSIIQNDNEYIKINVNSEVGKWLIVSNANVDGWKAYVDNKEARIYSANYILQGIYVPKGDHVVELIYKTTWYPSL